MMEIWWFSTLKVQDYHLKQLINSDKLRLEKRRQCTGRVGKRKQLLAWRYERGVSRKLAFWNIINISLQYRLWTLYMLLSKSVFRHIAKSLKWLWIFWDFVLLEATWFWSTLTIARNDYHIDFNPAMILKLVRYELSEALMACRTWNCTWSHNLCISS